MVLQTQWESLATVNVTWGSLRCLTGCKFMVIWLQGKKRQIFLKGTQRPEMTMEWWRRKCGLPADDRLEWTWTGRPSVSETHTHGDEGLIDSSLWLFSGLWRLSSRSVSGPAWVKVPVKPWESLCGLPQVCVCVTPEWWRTRSEHGKKKWWDQCKAGKSQVGCVGI